jgi:hypothetical protein
MAAKEIVNTACHMSFQFQKHQYSYTEYAFKVNKQLNIPRIKTKIVLEALVYSDDMQSKELLKFLITRVLHCPCNI